MLKLAEQVDAEHYLNDAIQLSQESGDDSALWREYTLLATIQHNQGNEKGVKESLLSATSFLRSPEAGDFSSPEHIYYPNRKETAYQLIHLLVQEKLIDEAWLVSEQIKQEAFLANLADTNISLSGSGAELYKDLSSQRLHLHSIEGVSAPIKATKEWQSWQARFRALIGQNKQVARLIAPVPVTVADMNGALQTSHSTIFDYVIGSDSSILFTLSPGGKLTATILNTSSKQLTGLVKFFTRFFCSK